MERSTICSICKVNNLAEQRRSNTTWCKRCERDRKREVYDSAHERAKKLRLTYNISQSQYDNMLAAQGGGCAICGATDNGSRFRFAVDHDHSCCPGKKSCGECVRGLLCTRCNTLLGMVNDRAALLDRARGYLARTSSSIAAL